jgi:hypothetical protein
MAFGVTTRFGVTACLDVIVFGVAVRFGVTTFGPDWTRGALVGAERRGPAVLGATVLGATDFDAAAFLGWLASANLIALTPERSCATTRDAEPITLATVNALATSKINPILPVMNRPSY